MSSLEKELVPNLLINCCKPSKTESEQQQEQPVAGKGWHSVDAPVSCGDRGVKNGTLAIFVGGEESTVTIASTMVGLVEGMVYAHKAGLDVGLYLEAISTGAAGSKSLDLYGKRILKRDFEAGFFNMGIVLPSLALAQQLYLSLKAHGEGYLEEPLFSFVFASDRASNPALGFFVSCKKLGDQPSSTSEHGACSAVEHGTCTCTCTSKLGTKLFGGCDGLRWSNQGGRRGGFVIVLKDPKPQIHNFRNSNPNVAKELQFAFQSTEKKAKATPRSRAQTRSPFSAKTLEGEILSSRNVVLEPLETRLSFPLRNPKQNPGRGKEKERNEQRAITIYPENTKTLSSRALSTLSLSPPFVPALNAETP
ncbi:3-hydroxyisobutyrate dehydrogenase-like 1 [Vigna angularis]|uniref:3-hydroxyisobutyrate dehydrogenase-like 1 n=1 Tax=Phaseolus angularis TaxID=3914 RepID=A0A8T0KUR7_PHAAN|nr:3-hydroxyisobutyrate dehydrogenase-like 1 [Vigna angularis]